MNVSEIRQLREKRAQLAEDAAKLIPAAGAAWTPEAKQSFDRMHAEIEELRQDIDRREKAAQAEAEVRGGGARRENPVGDETPEARTSAVAEYRSALRKHGSAKALTIVKTDTRAIVERLTERAWAAFREYLVKGETRMSEENRAILTGRDPEFRDLGVGTGSLGGYFVPQGFVYEIEEAMKWFGDMLNVCSFLDTATGNPLPHPTDNDTTNTGEQIAENTQVSDQDVSIGQITFNAWKYSTKMIKISIELLQDSAFDMEGYIKSKFAIRLGRILNTKFTVGVGTTEPNGIITAGTAGPTAVGSGGNTGNADSATNTVGSIDLIELEHSVDKAYRRGAAYMMHDLTLKYVKEILDKYGRPLWKPGLDAGDPDTINGYPYHVNNDMATLAASAKTVLFGQLSKYTVRRVKELAILRLNERFADYGQVAFIGFARYDGNLLDAGTHPVKYLVQHS